MSYNRTPTVLATWSDLRKVWMVALPGRLELPARDENEVADLVSRFAAGAAIRYIR